MRAIFSRPVAVVAAAIVLGGAIAFAAQAVVTDTNLVRLRVVETESDEGWDTNWHTHTGPAIVQVLEGQFKIYQNGCEPKVIHEGETYIEVPRVPVRAIAKGRIKGTTTQVLPGLVGEPSQVIVASPCQ